MKAALFLPYLILAMLLTSCVITIYNKRNLSVDKLEDRDIPKLKTHGIYVAEEEDRYLPLVLFADGYFHMKYSYAENPAAENSKYLIQLKSDSLFHRRDRRVGIWGWGVWWTTGDSIFMEQYVNQSGNYDLNYYDGILKSDTSFQLNYDLGSRAATRTLEFSFYPTEFRPDSSNYIQMHLDKFGDTD